MSRILTQSELSAWLRCRRKWYLGWYRALQRKKYDGTPLTVGTLVHHGLEAYYRPDNRGDPLTIIQHRAQALLEQYPDDSRDILNCAELAAVMVEGYMEWLEMESADADIQITGAEVPVEVQVGPYRLRGKIDARGVRRSDDLLLQLEHKSVGNLTDLPKTAQTNFQYLTYDLLAYLAELEKQEGIRRTDGILLNMLRKVKRTQRAKPPFYGRHEVRHNTAELRAHWKHVVRIAQESDAARALLDAGADHHRVVPPTPGRDCSFGCQFADICLTGMLDDGSDVEGFIKVAYRVHDPLERYAEDADAG